MSFRGNGLEWPVEPGLDTDDKAGDTDPARPRCCDRVMEVDRDKEDAPIGLVPKAVPPGLVPIPGCNLITPAAIPPVTGTRTAGGGGGGATAG